MGEPDVRATVAAMRDALAAEVVEIRETGAQTGRDCHGGVQVGQTSKRWTYSFTDVTGTRLSDDLPIKLVLEDGREADGEVVSHKSDALVVAVGEDLGTAIEQAVLVTDASFLLERLAWWLDVALEDDEVEFCWPLATSLVQPTTPFAADGDVDPADLVGLNEAQCDAVRRALGTTTTFIWGPPGTGKTTTVAHVVAAHYRAGRSVLLVSNTNVAVDTALERIAELLADDPGFGDGAVLRHRAIVKDELRERFGEYVIPEEVAARRARPRVEERLELSRQLDELDSLAGLERFSDEEREAEVIRLRDRLEVLDAELLVGADGLLEQARILATTVYQTWLGAMPDRTFDVVVIDEASMLMLPMALYAAGQARHALVVAGDFRQLPPIVTSRDPDVIRWLSTDAFTAAGIPESLARDDPPGHLVALREQYRMRAPIAAVVSELFYPDNALVTGRSDAIEVAGLLPTDAPLLWVDTSALGAWAGIRGRGSRFNPLHALLVAELAASCVPLDAVDTVVVDEDSPVPGRLGLVAPYREQERLIAGLLVDRYGREARGWVTTVHRIQGNEKSVVVVDLTDARGVSPGPGLRAAGRDDPQSRLLNVAISRARDHLVVVLDATYVRHRTPRSATARLLLEALEEYGQQVRIEPAGGGLALRWPGGETTEPAVFALHAPDSLEHRLAGDLNRASTDITIYTPQVTGHGMAAWSEPLRGALARGVTVRVVTRPVSEQPGAASVIAQMTAAGLDVELRPRTDVRLALVDGSLLWVGGDLGLPRPDGSAWLRARSAATAQALLRALRPA